MSENSKALSKPDAKYDLVKFFLSLLVLAIHTKLYSMILYPWLRIAVPLFFMISAYFLFSKMRDASPDKQKVMLKKFVIRNLQLYFSWFIILLPMTIYLRKEQYFSGGLLENAWAILRSILFGSSFVASWFIMATIIGVLIIYWLCRILKKDLFVLVISLVVFCIVTLASSYESVIADTFLFTAITKYKAVSGSFVCSFPAALFWVFIGKLCAEQKLRFKSTGLLIALIICSCGALFAEWKFVISLDGSYNNDSYFMLAPLCVLLFLGIQKIKPTYWEKSVYLRRLSTIIYVTHGSLIPIAGKLISMVVKVQISFLPFLVTLLGSVAVYVFIEIANKKCSSKRIGKILNMLY